MISFAPIWAIVLRHGRICRRDINFLLATFYWPSLDILMWGFLGSWIQNIQGAQQHNYEIIALLGVLLWQVVGRGCNILLATFTEELWANNIVNLFSLPLHIIEWMCGIIIFYIIMMGLTTLAGMLTIIALYDVAIGKMVSTFLLFFPPLFFASLWIGFTCLQIVVLFGKRSIELGYVLCWCFMPFSGAYYPIDVLPTWGQTISAWLPMSYLFKGLRGYLMYQHDPTSYLIKAYLLSILYASSAIILFIYCFNWSKQNGLARLAD